jgi:hypothetical protein
MPTLAWICIDIILVCATYIFTERYTVWKMFKMLESASAETEEEVQNDE